MGLNARSSGTATIGSQTASTVVLGPFKLENSANILLVSTTGASGTTTPTAYTLQTCAEPTGTRFGNDATTITASATANAVVTAKVANIAATYVRVISGAAFAAGTATLDVLVQEQS